MTKFKDLPQAVELENNNNTRHLGGYKTVSGKTVVRTKLIRSGSPGKFTQKDIALLLSEYNLKHVVDLRTGYEASTDASLTGVSGVSYSHLPLSAEVQQSLSFNDEISNVLIQMVRSAGGSAEAAAEAMKKTYADIVTDEALIERTRRVFDILLENEGGCVLYHCAAGKDRTGVVSALILSALGAERSVVLEDYLHTNAYISESAAKTLAEVARAAGDSETAAGVRGFLVADRAYLEGALSMIERKYGSMEKYLGERLGLTAGRLARLRDIYTEEQAAG
jgi:protein-tyrosine phosphatase